MRERWIGWPVIRRPGKFLFPVSGRRTSHTATTVPLLRRTHVHHRDLRARQRAKAPTHARAGCDQDRHLMMLSSLIQHSTEARHLGRLSPGSTPACADQQHWRAIRSFAPARAPRIRAKATQSPASAQFPQHSRRRQIPIAPAALSVPHTPRFRALTLFGRRLSERGMVSACQHPKTCTRADGNQALSS